MDLPPAWSQSCICSQILSVPQAYTCHKHSCLKMKKQLSGVLEKAKNVWKTNKHHKTEEMGHCEATNSSTQLVAAEPLLNVTFLPGIHQQVRFLIQSPWLLVEWFSVHQTIKSSSTNYTDLHQSLAEWRTCREYIMPRCYQDIAPEPPAALPHHLCRLHWSAHKWSQIHLWVGLHPNSAQHMHCWSEKSLNPHATHLGYSKNTMPLASQIMILEKILHIMT